MREFLDHLVFQLEKDFLFMPEMPQSCCCVNHMVLKGFKGLQDVLRIRHASIDTTARPVQKGIGLPL
jgi:hypothetical protein